MQNMIKHLKNKYKSVISKSRKTFWNLQISVSNRFSFDRSGSGTSEVLMTNILNSQKLWSLLLVCDTLKVYKTYNWGLILKSSYSRNSVNHVINTLILARHLNLLQFCCFKILIKQPYCKSKTFSHFVFQTKFSKRTSVKLEFFKLETYGLLWIPMLFYQYIFWKTSVFMTQYPVL